MMNVVLKRIAERDALHSIAGPNLALLAQAFLIVEGEGIAMLTLMVVSRGCECEKEKEKGREKITSG